MRYVALLLLVALPVVPVASRAAPATPSAYLARMDASGDGRVELAEYLDYMDTGFARMDANGDGVVDASERPPSPRNRAPLTIDRHRQNLAAAFQRQDRDHSGYLNARELAAPPQ